MIKYDVIKLKNYDNKYVVLTTTPQGKPIKITTLSGFKKYGEKNIPHSYMYNVQLSDHDWDPVLYNLVDKFGDPSLYVITSKIKRMNNKRKELGYGF